MKLDSWMIAEVKEMAASGIAVDSNIVVAMVDEINTLRNRLASVQYGIMKIVHKVDAVAGGAQ